jgi:hypothetical protein
MPFAFGALKAGFVRFGIHDSSSCLLKPLFRVDSAHIRSLNPIQVKRVFSTRDETNDQNRTTEHHRRPSAAGPFEANTRCQPRRFGWKALGGILLDRTAISRIESQARYVMDYEAAAIARALKVSVAWLYGETR